MPAMHLVSTDLPAPLSPHNAVTLPEGRSRSTWYSAWTGPKCLSSPRTLSSGASVGPGSATAAVISAALSPVASWELTPPRSAAASVGDYEILLAEQTAAPALLHSVATSMNLSLITVDSMLDLSTQTGVSSEAGCWLPVTPDGGVVVPLTSAGGGVAPARRTVASATACCAWGQRC